MGYAEHRRRWCRGGDSTVDGGLLFSDRRWCGYSLWRGGLSRDVGRRTLANEPNDSDDRCSDQKNPSRNRRNLNVGASTLWAAVGQVLSTRVPRVVTRLAAIL